MRKVVFVIVDGVAAVLLIGWLVVLPSIVVKAVRIPNGAKPSQFGVAYEDVRFPTRGGGLSLSGWWMPARGAKGVVIFVHGGNANRRDVYAGGLEMQAALVRAGYDVLAFDQRNQGASDATPDGQITLGNDESRDALGAIDYAAKRAPGLRIALLADSMGGATAIYAAHDDKRVAKLLLIDPVLDAHTVRLGALYANIGLPHLLLPAVDWSAETFFSHAKRQRDALAEAKELTLPVLLIQDDRDPVCLPRFADALAHADRHVTLVVSHDPDRPAGRWGYHIAAYRLRPKVVEDALERFLERAP
jgi:pimeloyl-ACP methyl ester carboxylesterase